MRVSLDEWRADRRRALDVVAAAGAGTRRTTRPATTVTATRWAMAGGYAGGPTNAETFILIANTGADTR